MTREQLDAIRARVEAATPGPWLTDSCLDVYTEQVREIDPDIGIELYKTVYSHHTAGPEGTQPWHDTHFMAHAREDVPALLAEVERLRDAHAMVVQVSGELCEKCGWAMRFPGEKCRCELLAEVERLTAELHRMKSRPVEAEFSRLDTMWQQLVRERDEAVHELSRLKGVRSEVNTAKLNDAFTEGTLKAGEAMRPLVAAAFSRGVAAMRDALLQRFDWHGDVADSIRAEPVPEDKP